MHEFLPGKDFTPNTQITGLDGCHHAEPCLAQIRATLIEEHTEAGVLRVSSQHISDQLVTRIARSPGLTLIRLCNQRTLKRPRLIGCVLSRRLPLLRELFGKFDCFAAAPDAYLDSRKQVPIEHGIEVLVGLDNCRFPALEIRLCQLRLKQEIATSHINFGAIKSAVGQRHPRLPSKNRHIALRNSKHSVNCRRINYAGRTEYIHQQRVGTHGGVEFAPASFSFGQRPALGMNLVKAAEPTGLRGDSGIRRIIEISVPPLLGRVHDYGKAAIAFYMRTTLRVASIAKRKFVTQR